jgi:hypothetical protein
VYLGWDSEWAKNRTNWLDLVVNIVGFVPFGLLLFLQFVKGRVLGNRWQVTGGRCREAAEERGIGSEREKSKDEIAVHPSAARNDKAGKENPPVSSFAQGGKRKGEIAAQPSAARNDMPQIVIAVILAVVAGLVVSFAIEYLQAYLPSRDSSMRDLVTNTAGTLIGAIAAAWLLRNRFAAAMQQ